MESPVGAWMLREAKDYPRQRPGIYRIAVLFCWHLHRLPLTPGINPLIQQRVRALNTAKTQYKRGAHDFHGREDRFDGLLRLQFRLAINTERIGRIILLVSVFKPIKYRRGREKNQARPLRGARLGHICGPKNVYGPGMCLLMFTPVNVRDCGKVHNSIRHDLSAQAADTFGIAYVQSITVAGALLRCLVRDVNCPGSLRNFSEMLADKSISPNNKQRTGSCHML